MTSHPYTCVFVYVCVYVYFILNAEIYNTVFIIFPEGSTALRPRDYWLANIWNDPRRGSTVCVYCYVPDT